ncbi:MAG: hypothetical protein ACR2G2_10080 [Pseudonocardia sp.]
MLKKAGIVVATVAAGLLSVSPLAFAGDFQGDNDHHKSDNDHHKSHHSRASCEQDNRIDNSGDGRGHRGGLNILNIEKNTLQVDPQVCNNNILDNIVVAVLGRAKGDFKSD